MSNETLDLPPSHTMLWYDDSKLPLAEKVQRAAEYFERKYDRPPTICAANRSEPGLAETKEAGDVKIVAGHHALLPHHFELS